MSELIRKENETALQHHKRLVFGKLVDKILSDEDYVELSKYVYDKEYSSDVARRMMYGSSYTLKLMDGLIEQKLTENNSNLEDEYFKELEIKKQELYKEKVKLQDQRRELNKILRENAREEYFCDLIKNSINDSELKPFNYITREIKNSDNDLLVFLNDTHYGLKVENYWNKYNPEIFVEYLQKYLDKIISIKDKNDSENCYLFLGGDIISGLIHNLIRIENSENVIEQVQHVSEYISNFVNELSKIFSNVYIHNVAGNHSRLMQNKKEDIKDEKLDLLITWYMKARLSNLNNVKIMNNDIDNTIAVFDIRGKVYYGVHGDLDSPNKVVDSLTQMLEIKPYGILMAHRHHFSADTIHNVKVISSGSFAGVDEYCITKRISGSPCQTVCVCNKDGIDCIYDIVLN